jgi:integral membrane protein (TIGR01906 family)
LVVALTYVAFFFILRRWTQISRLATEVMTGAALTVAIIIGLGVFALTGFDDLFRRFHLLAFTNDLWQLNPRTDRLIQMFPQGFWFDVTVLIGVMTVVEAVVLGLPAFLYLRWSQHREEQPQTEQASQPSK